MWRAVRGAVVGMSLALARRRWTWPLAVAALAAVLVASVPPLLRASDHADPTMLQGPETNITGLFFYPQGDQMVLIFNIRRALRNPKPYDLTPYTYEVHMDLTTPVAFDNAEDRARYGGTVTAPDKLHADASITIRLNNDVTLRDITFKGLKDTDKIRQYFDVRDDPFIFPRFFEKNVISMVMSIPLTAFPAGQRDFILWGTTSKDGTLIDHVGRSIRTQLPRFGFLNTVAPRDQVQAIMKEKAFWDGVFNFLKDKKEWWSGAIADILQFTVQLRKYDLQPDVMIYSSRFQPGYPNGRQLADDVVARACDVGDCLLQELASIEGTFPRATVNDKPFLAEWPYIGEPWPAQAEAPGPTASILPYVIALLLAIVIGSWALVEVLRWLVRRLWQLWRRKAAAA
jgi:hypothetical protein